VGHRLLAPLHTMTQINFHTLIAKAGTKEGARPLFERLVAQLVRLLHASVRQVAANPGDWGIDVFVGMLDEGGVHVWQSKFFIDGIGETQKKEIRESFKACLSAAAEEGHVLLSWTLCVPVSMDGPTTKWWDTWKKKQQRDHGLAVELWDETELEGLCLSPEAAAIRRTYFALGETGDEPHPRAIEAVPPEEDLEHMLFVRQLRAAEISELDAAKQEFFNAELVARDVADKANQVEVQYLDSVRAEALSLWSYRYNQRCKEGASPLLPGLHSDVMAALEQYHRSAGRGPVPLSVVHRFGSMHQVVETGRAGWIRDFRRIVEEHEQ
jgi:hypothetical protein